MLWLTVQHLRPYDALPIAKELLNNNNKIKLKEVKKNRRLSVKALINENDYHYTSFASVAAASNNLKRYINRSTKMNKYQQMKVLSKTNTIKINESSDVLFKINGITYCYVFHSLHQILSPRWRRHYDSHCSLHYLKQNNFFHERRGKIYLKWDINQHQEYYTSDTLLRRIIGVSTWCCILLLFTG